MSKISTNTKGPTFVIVYPNIQRLHLRTTDKELFTNFERWVELRNCDQQEKHICEVLELIVQDQWNERQH